MGGPCCLCIHVFNPRRHRHFSFPAWTGRGSGDPERLSSPDPGERGEEQGLALGPASLTGTLHCLSAQDVVYSQCIFFF